MRSLSQIAPIHSLENNRQQKTNRNTRSAKESTITNRPLHLRPIPAGWENVSLFRNQLSSIQFLDGFVLVANEMEHHNSMMPIALVVPSFYLLSLSFLHFFAVLLPFTELAIDFQKLPLRLDLTPSCPIFAAVWVLLLHI